MKTVSSFLLIALVWCLSSCKDPVKSTTLKIQIVPKYGTQAFQLGNTYTDKNSRRMNFERFKFFLSHIQLVKNDNSVVPLKSVTFLTLENLSTLTFDVTATTGDFKALQFSIGLDSSQNLTNPSDVSPTDVLGANNDMWWGATNKYVFSRLEGSSDTVASGTGNLYWLLLYHVGFNQNYRTVTLTKTISIPSEKTTTLVVDLDVEQLFFGPSPIDIKTAPVTHSNDYALTATKFADNFSQAFVLE